jgi:hypothetical protein
MKHCQFQIFVNIKNIALKSNFYNWEILILTQILIEYPITITERRALLEIMAHIYLAKKLIA